MSRKREEGHEVSVPSSAEEQARLRESETRAAQAEDYDGCGTMLMLGLALGILALRLVVGGRGWL
jgi:hypothetical protein